MTENWITLKPCTKRPDRYCNCEGFVPACWDGSSSIAIQESERITDLRITTKSSPSTVGSFTRENTDERANP